MAAPVRFPRPLLDRFLLGADGQFPPATMGEEEYAAAVRRDAAALLNTRAPCDADSVIGYGLPDFVHLSPDSPDDRWRIAAAIRETLERFETRLANVEVDVGEDGSFTVTADTDAADAGFVFNGLLNRGGI